MINQKPKQVTEWDGFDFDVYDVETGEILLPSQVAEKSFPDDRYLGIIVNGFCLTWEGYLFLTKNDSGVVYIPKDNKYIIQINGEKYVRW